MRQVVLDTETTGLHVSEGHRIIEIGCIELVNRKPTGLRYHQYINPQKEIDAGALAVHGISNQFLADKPLFADIIDQFVEFIKGAELIIHNAPFDVGFINNEFMLAQKNHAPVTDFCKIIDSLILARQLHVGQRNSLDALCKRYQIDNSERDFHGALLDAHLLAQVYLMMTGGQGSLFDEAPITEETTQKAVNLAKLSAKERKLLVVKATPEELEQHQAQLQKMMDKGKCVWISE